MKNNDKDVDNVLRLVYSGNTVSHKPVAVCANCFFYTGGLCFSEDSETMNPESTDTCEHHWANTHLRIQSELMRLRDIAEAVLQKLSCKDCSCDGGDSDE